ncbi:hypothetical protein VCR14J2_620076 [Vibrio coralliirubri]|nr:hypothetical protein VCR14J2_620076 [Vibrio coralliirubri]
MGDWRLYRPYPCGNISGLVRQLLDRLFDLCCIGEHGYGTDLPCQTYFYRTMQRQWGHLQLPVGTFKLTQ